MPINKIYLHLLDEEEKIIPYQGDHRMTDDLKFDYFLLDIHKLTGLEVGIYRGKIEDLPEDTLLIFYLDFSESFTSIAPNLPLSIQRRIFVLNNLMTSYHSYEGVNFAGSMPSTIYEVFMYRIDRPHPGDMEESVYFQGDIKAMQGLYQREDWETKSGYDLWHFEDNVIQELCIYLKEYCQKYDTIKHLNHFESGNNGGV